MKNLEIYKKRKDELVEKTLDLMPTALSGDSVNRTFYFDVDSVDNELIVDYIVYAGQQVLNERCFYTVKNYETPDPESFGYESIEEMDFDACGFAAQIEAAIDYLIINMEIFDETQL